MVFDVDHDFEGPRGPKAHLGTVNRNLSHHLGRPFTAKMLSKCRIGSESDYSDNVDVGSMQLGVDINDALVGATGVQLTERAGCEIEPGITYFKWYSRRGQYKMCGDTECACMKTVVRRRRTTVVRRTRSII